MRRLGAKFHSSSLPANNVATANYGPLLDQTNVPASPLFARGLRKLMAAWSGNCIQVYCNGTTFDVGFNSDGSLNVAFLAASCGSNPGYVPKVYDQSGNGNDWVARHPTSTTQMFRIWTGSAVETLTNSSGVAIPCLRSINTNSDLVSNAYASTQTGTAFTYAMVGAIENTTTGSIDGRMLSLYGASNTDGSDANGLSLRRTGNATPSASWNLQRNTNSGGPSVTVAGAYSDPAQVMFVVNDPTYTLYLEGVAGTPATVTEGAFNYNHDAWGWTGNANSSVGEWIESVGWATAATSTQLAAINKNQAGYWATASAPSNPTGTTGGGTGGTSTGSGATNLPGWTLEMDEGFDTNAAEGQFFKTYTNMGSYDEGSQDTWAKSNGGGSQYSQKYVSASNSTMIYRIWATSSASYGAAVIPIFPGKSGPYEGFTYYRREVRIRCLNPVSWQKIALLLWSDADNWNNGEVDFPEMNLNGTAGGFNHWPGNPSSQDSYSGSTSLSDWHIFAIEWTANKLVWIQDGVVVKTLTSHVPTVPFHDVLQCERVLSSSPSPVAGQTCNLEFDYYRAWTPS